MLTYPLVVVEETLPELAKAEVFTKADLKDGFLQIQLDVKQVTTFVSPWGRYCWLRLPYGISLQSISSSNWTNVLKASRVYTKSDDLLIIGQGETEEAILDHNQNLKGLLDRCSAKNITLNKRQGSIQMQGSFIHWLCVVKGRLEARSEEGRGNNQDGVTGRCASSTKFCTPCQGLVEIPHSASLDP